MTNQGIKCPLFVALDAMDVDKASGDLKLLFLDQDNRHHHLRLAHGLVPTVTVSLMGLARKSWEAGADPQARQEAVQFLTLTKVSPVTSSTGAPGLILLLENQLPFPLVFDQNVLVSLRSALDTVAADGKPPGKGSQN